MTLGEKIVRTEFNPSKTDAVSIIKEKTADIINFLDKNYQGDTEDQYGEYRRLCKEAFNKFEEACMFAVKALTV